MRPTNGVRAFRVVAILGAISVGTASCGGSSTKSAVPATTTTVAPGGTTTTVSTSSTASPAGPAASNGGSGSGSSFCKDSYSDKGIFDTGNSLLTDPQARQKVLADLNVLDGEAPPAIKSAVDRQKAFLDQLIQKIASAGSPQAAAAAMGPFLAAAGPQSQADSTQIDAFCGTSG